MRASATSRTNTPASIPAPQVKADVNKTDTASPFALLMEMAPAKDPAKTVKKDAKDSGDKPADDKVSAKQNDVKPEDKSVAKQGDKTADTQTNSKPVAPAKAGKPDKDKDAAETGKGATDDKQVASVEQQISELLVPAPVTQAPIATPPVTGTDTDDDIQIDGPAPLPVAAMPVSDIQTEVPGPMDTPPDANAVATAPTAPQAPIAAQTQAENSETPEPVAAQPVAAAVTPADVKPAAPAKGPVKPNTAVAKSDTADAVKPEAAGIEFAKSTLIRDTDTTKDATAKEEVDHPAIAKDDGLKTVAIKGHIAQSDIPKNDGGDAHKVATSQPEPPPVEVDNAAAPAGAKPAPQSATASNAEFAINNIAAPQATQNSQAPVATQHVQVSAQAAPNLPALAVEIAAKSQSGAKQFDIRLDPPELGRVDVRLSIDATGKASAHLSADQPQTLSLLQKDAPILARALREAGLDVSQDGLNFSLRQQSSGQNGHDGNNGRFGNTRTFSLAATANIDAAATTIAYRGLANGRLDIRV